jgi:hypothetical protein
MKNTNKKKETNMKETEKCSCGKEAEYGAHGIKEDEVYSEYYCEKCWNNRNKC